MRTKTRATKFRSKLTRAAADATTTRPLPALNLETHEQIGEFIDTDPSEDSEQMDLLKGEEDNPLNKNEVIITDCVDKAGAFAHNSTDPSEDSDLLEGDSFCVKCNGGVDLLVCSNSECPIAIHKDCLLCDPKYDQNGNFCCPYCWYKTLVHKTKEMRQNVMLAKKALSGFIDSKLVADDGEKRKQGIVHGTAVDITQSGRDGNCNDCENSRNKGNIENKGKIENVTPLDEHRVDPCCGQEETIVESLGTKRVKKLDKENVVQSHLDKFGANEKRIQEEGLRQVDDASANGSHDASVEKNNHVTEKTSMCKTTTLNTEEDTVAEIPTKDACSYGSSESYTRPLKRLVKKRSESKLECRDVSTPNKSPSQLKKPRHLVVDSPMKQHPPLPRLNLAASGSTIKPKTESTLQIASMEFCNGQRRRLLWTPEEEEMLKEGVKHFSTSVNKNLPWRKILEFGQEVFHPARNPSDLKDKWRKLLP